MISWNTRWTSPVDWTMVRLTGNGTRGRIFLDDDRHEVHVKCQLPTEYLLGDPTQSTSSDVFLWYSGGVFLDLTRKMGKHCLFNEATRFVQKASFSVLS